MLTLILTTASGTQDITGLVTELTWSGAYNQGARKLQVGVVSSPYDQHIQTPDMAPGGAVQLFQDSRVLFSGTIVSREKSTGSTTLSVTCYDRGFYLLKNQGVYQFTAQTPDAIARRVCGDFGIPVGDLAPSAAAVTRNFIGVSLYKIIMTGYTLAAREDGKAYQLRFDGDRMTVVEIRENEETLVLEGGVNLQSATASDSIEHTVTQVAIYDSGNQVVRTVQNPALLSLYGVIQQALRQKDGEDAGAEAQKMLDENGLSQTITVENLGNVACITGNTVVVKEPYTGLYGLFWITADSHVWKDGQYTNRLSLSYQRLMDEQEAGSLPNKTGAQTASRTGTGGSGGSGGSTDSSGSAAAPGRWQRIVLKGQGQTGPSHVVSQTTR